jgi:N-formylglutamate deformylase
MATAIHAGHDLRPEVAAIVAVDEATRWREEDPYTDRLAEVVSLRAKVDRSRFEVDLNRHRSGAFYLNPEQAWGLSVWAHEPTPPIVAASLAIYDAFYGKLAEHLDRLAARGSFVVLDLHSYNHRRDGPDQKAAPAELNPDVNLGTGALDRHRWGSLVDRFATDLRGSLPEEITIGENVCFRGGHLSRWVNERYPRTGCALAIEFKKSFMDEWSGDLDQGQLELRRDALGAALPGLLEELGSR